MRKLNGQFAPIEAFLCSTQFAPIEAFFESIFGLVLKIFMEEKFLEMKNFKIEKVFKNVGTKMKKKRKIKNNDNRIWPTSSVKFAFPGRKELRAFRVMSVSILMVDFYCKFVNLL